MADNPQSLHHILKPGCWTGRRVFIIGSGPSLKGFDFSKLEGELVVTVNQNYLHYPDTALNVSTDSRFFKNLCAGRYGAHAAKILEDAQFPACWVASDPEQVYPNWVRTVPFAGLSGISNILEQGVATGENSGTAAINIAHCLGSREIYLLGFDMGGTTAGAHQEWFHEGHPNHRQPNDVYRRFLKYFPEISSQYRRFGTTVYNLSQNSAIQEFEKIRFEDIAPAYNPVFTTFATQGTSYQRCAENLEKTLVRHGCQTWVEVIPNRGTWKKNVAYKPQHILNAMEHFAGRPIVWIDADAICERSPSLFYRQHVADVMALLVNWSTFPNVMRNDMEMLTGTIWLRNNDHVKSLVSAWSKKVMAGTTNDTHKLYEQRTFHQLITRTPEIEFRTLPNSYVKIFDLMARVQEPVFSHYQESRRNAEELRSYDD